MILPMTEPNISTPCPSRGMPAQRLGRIGLCVVLVLLTGSCRVRPPVLEQIRTLGALTVATRLGPESYYHGISGPKGPEFELVSEFAATLGVPVVFVALPSDEAVLHEVSAGRAQLGAAALGVLDHPPPAIAFSRPYTRTTLHLIERGDETPAADLSALADARVGVVGQSLQARQLQSLMKDLSHAPSLVSGDSLPGLLTQVQTGDLDATIATGQEWALLKSYFPDLQPTIRLLEDYALAFVVPSDDPDWRSQTGRFVDRIRPEVPALMDRYHAPPEPFDYQAAKALIPGAMERLSTLRPLFEATATALGEDWRLLAAIGYQESRWDPDAVSATGVRGIMMLTQQTAANLEVRDRNSAEDSIRGGSRYLHGLRAALPEHIHEPDRTALALAVYNVGLSHLEDARVLTKRHGKNPDQWRNVRQYLPALALNDPKNDTRHGYARGNETVLFVDNVQHFTATLEWLFPEGSTSVATSH